MEKLSINWGARMVIFYLSFVALIMFLVFKSMQQDVDLVSKDYYERELKYQDVIDAKQNIAALSSPVVAEVIDNAIQLQLPDCFNNKVVKGTVFFYRPSDSKLDVRKEIVLNETLKQSFNKSQFSKGIYKMEIDFSCDGKKYFMEKVIVI